VGKKNPCENRKISWNWTKPLQGKKLLFLNGELYALTRGLLMGDPIFLFLFEITDNGHLENRRAWVVCIQLFGSHFRYLTSDYFLFRSPCELSGYSYAHFSLLKFMRIIAVDFSFLSLVLYLLIIKG
jgi:hypothetical protein